MLASQRPAAHVLSHFLYMIGLFVRPQTQRESNVVRFSAVVSGEERCVTTLKTAVQQTNKSFTLTEVSCQEVLKLIQKIPVNKATSIDNISAYLLKDAVPIIASSLTYIINLSVRSGIFPNAWKIAKVTTIFKEGLKSHPNNYRPISVLPVVSNLIITITKLSNLIGSQLP